MPEGVIPVVERADLVAMKLYAGGPQDPLDVALLLARDTGLRNIVDTRIHEQPASARAPWEKLKQG